MKAQQVVCGEKSKNNQQGGNTVVVVGGSGGMSDRYRDVVESRGWELRHYERRLPGGFRHAASHISLIVVIVSMVSHPLREQAERLAERDRAKIVYLRTPSVSALRDAVAAIAEKDQATLRPGPRASYSSRR